MSLGANSAQVVIQWFVTDVNSTGMYPIVDPASVQATTTDAELRVFAAAARARNVTLALSLMLDPDWTLASQLGCRTNYPFPPGCGWRGQVASCRLSRCSWSGVTLPTTPTPPADRVRMGHSGRRLHRKPCLGRVVG